MRTRSTPQRSYPTRSRPCNLPCVGVMLGAEQQHRSGMAQLQAALDGERRPLRQQQLASWLARVGGPAQQHLQLKTAGTSLPTQPPPSHAAAELEVAARDIMLAQCHALLSLEDPGGDKDGVCSFTTWHGQKHVCWLVGGKQLSQQGRSQPACGKCRAPKSRQVCKLLSAVQLLPCSPSPVLSCNPHPFLHRVPAPRPAVRHASSSWRQPAQPTQAGASGGRAAISGHGGCRPCECQRRWPGS